MRGVVDTLAWREVGAPDVAVRVDAIRDGYSVDKVVSQHHVNEAVFRYSRHGGNNFMGP